MSICLSTKVGSNMTTLGTSWSPSSPALSSSTELDLNWGKSLIRARQGTGDNNRGIIDATGDAGATGAIGVTGTDGVTGAGGVAGLACTPKLVLNVFKFSKASFRGVLYKAS